MGVTSDVGRSCATAALLWARAVPSHARKAGKREILSRTLKTLAVLRFKVAGTGAAVSVQGQADVASYPFAVAAVMVLSLSTDSLFVGLRAMQALPNGLGGSACFFCEIRTLLLTAPR